MVQLTVARQALPHGHAIAHETALSIGSQHHATDSVQAHLLKYRRLPKRHGESRSKQYEYRQVSPGKPRWGQRDGLPPARQHDGLRTVRLALMRPGPAAGPPKAPSRGCVVAPSAPGGSFEWSLRQHVAHRGRRWFPLSRCSRYR